MEDKKENHDEFYLNWARQNGKLSNNDYKMDYTPLMYIGVGLVISLLLAIALV